MDLTGFADGPPAKVGTSVADLTAGMLAAHGVVLALYARDRTGLGQRVDLAMLDAMASLLTFNAGIYFATGESPRRRGNAHPTIVPYETFPAADGWINLAVANDALWRRFCAAVGRDGWCDDPRFATAAARVENRTVLVPLIGDLIARKPRSHWVERLEAAGIPCGGIRTVGEVCDDPDLAARGLIAELMHPAAGPLRVIDTPIRLSATPGAAVRPPPLLGEHSREILAGIVGLEPAEVDALERIGAIRCQPIGENGPG
jgi:formyl-CoA transferase